MSEKPTLKDVLNYTPDEYLTGDDIAWIRRTFSDAKTLKILRKVFVPSIIDGDLPLEDFAKDGFIIDTDWRQIPEHEIKALVVGRQDAIKFVFGGLIRLKVIASQKEISEAEEIELRKKNSVK